MSNVAQQLHRSGRMRAAGARFEVICRRWSGMLYDLVKFSNAPRKNKGFGRAERAQTPYFFVKLAKS
jgi:hypothetical protein